MLKKFKLFLLLNFHWFFDWALKKNTIVAEIDDLILINYTNQRLSGNCAVVMELDGDYWIVSGGIILKAYKPDNVKAKMLSSEEIVFNLRPHEYWIIQKKTLTKPY